MTPRPLAKLSLCLLLCLPSITLCVRAQTTATDPESVLSTQLIGQRFILHNMSDATNIRGSWDGHAATLDVPRWHIFAALTVRKIKLKGTQVKLEATRNQIVRNNTGTFSLSPIATPVTLTLTLKGDPATLAPTLRDAIFFPSLDAALAAVPEDFQKEVPPQTDEDPATPTPSACDCAGTNGTCTAGNDPGTKPPKVLSYVVPELSDEARQNHISGSVEIGIRLNETGTIVDEWIVREAGHGLDEETAIAISKQKYAPATCHGTPIGATYFTDIGLQSRQTPVTFNTH